MADTAAPQQDEVVQLQDPSGQIASVTPQDAATLQQAGYSQLSPEQIAEQQRQEKFGSTGQQIITGLEGVGEGATFGLSTGLEKLAGVKPEDIRARKEENPGAHLIGQGLGLAGSSLIPGIGEANLLEKAGAGGAELAGLGAEAAGAHAAEAAAETARGLGMSAQETAQSINQAREVAMAPFSQTAKIGSKAVKYGIENMLVSGGDEVSKYMSDDPSQAEGGVGMAMANVGLSGLLGGTIGAGVGAISPLWKVGMSGRLGGILGAIRDKVGGVEGIVPEGLSQSLQDSGMELSPEIKAGLSDIPEIQKIVKDLDQSDATGSGQAFQKSMQNFRSQSADSLVQALGKTPEEVEGLASLSKADAGEAVKDAFVKEIKDRYKPIADEYGVTSNQFSKVPLVPEAKASIAEKLGQLGQEQGWIKSPSSPELKLLNTAIEELPLQENLQDLQNYQSRIGSQANAQGYNQGLSRAGELIKKVLRDSHAELLEGAVAKDSPELLERLKLNNASYKTHMDALDEVGSRLKPGRYSGTSSFLQAVKDMSPEQFIQRLGNENDAGLLKVLQKNHPAAAEALRDYKISNMLRAASFRAGEGQVINPQTLLKALDEKMSPEFRKFLLPDEVEPKVKAIQALLEHFNGMPHNFSNTARTLDRLWSSMPGSALALATMVAGHNPAIGFLVGGMTKILGRDAPDAIKLGLLKFLGSSEPMEAEGFKSMVDFISHTVKGETLASKAVKNIFKAGAQVGPEALSQKTIERLDEKLKEYQQNPRLLFNTAGKTAHYLPTHGTMLAQTAASSVNYLNSMRPVVAKQNPLDSDLEPSKTEKAQYDRALTIAESPLSVLSDVKDGSVTPKDITTMKTLYPGLYDAVSKKIFSEMVSAKSKDVVIPYKTRLGLSLFLGQPLDSTMTQAGILALQPKPNVSPQQQEQAQVGRHHGGGGGAHSMKNIGKLATMDQTPGQARQASKINQA